MKVIVDCLFDTSNTQNIVLRQGEQVLLFKREGKKMRRTGGAIVKTFPLKGASSLEKGIEYILVIVVKDTDGLLTRNHICLPGYFTSCKDIITCNNLRGQITIIQ